MDQLLVRESNLLLQLGLLGPPQGEDGGDRDLHVVGGGVESLYLYYFVESKPNKSLKGILYFTYRRP